MRDSGSEKRWPNLISGTLDPAGASSVLADSGTTSSGKNRERPRPLSDCDHTYRSVGPGIQGTQRVVRTVTGVLIPNRPQTPSRVALLAVSGQERPRVAAAQGSVIYDDPCIFRTASLAREERVLCAEDPHQNVEQCLVAA